MKTEEFKMMPTKEELARHEAAHFVVAWAVDCPDGHANIVPEDQKRGTLGFSGGSEPERNFDIIVTVLAGPVADGWEMANEEIIAHEKQYYQGENGDWLRVVRTLSYSGIDTDDTSALEAALAWCVRAVRAILTVCRENWEEVENILTERGRIGFADGHSDGGMEAARLFVRWGDENGDVPENVRTLVERLRSEFYEFAHDTIYETR